MKTLAPEISDAERAVNAYKHELLVRVMAEILRQGLAKHYISPADIPEDIVEPEHRQGVASNAWNALASLEIIDKVPLNFTEPGRHIFGGRTANTNENAKGRMVAVYFLANRELAFTWAQRNQVDLHTPAAAPVQMQLTETT